jgi:hypothetical protein
VADTVNLQSVYNSYGADRIYILANLADAAVVNGELYQQNLQDNLVDREATSEALVRPTGLSLGYHTVSCMSLVLVPFFKRGYKLLGDWHQSANKPKQLGSFIKRPPWSLPSQDYRGQLRPCQRKLCLGKSAICTHTFTCQTSTRWICKGRQATQERSSTLTEVESSRYSKRITFVAGCLLPTQLSC